VLLAVSKYNIAQGAPKNPRVSSHRTHDRTRTRPHACCFIYYLLFYCFFPLFFLQPA
jgi:hypothetical protein